MLKIAAGLLIALLSITAANAADFTAPIRDDDGQPLCVDEKAKPGECPADKVFTLATAVRNALYATYQDEQNISGDEKYRRAELGQGLRGATDLKLKAEDVALIKKMVAKLYGPLVVRDVWNLLDPPAGKK